MRKRYWVSTLVVFLFSLAAIYPIVYIFANSFMSSGEILARYGEEITSVNGQDFISNGVHFVDFGLIPHAFSLEQYRILFFESPGYLRMFWNSVLILVPILLGQCLIAPIGAFGFENLRWRYKEAVYFTYIVIMLMPSQILLVPNFIVAGWLNLRDSYWAIILPALFHPLGFFLIRQQLKGFPRECTEAASLDGAGPWAIYWHIVFPNLSSVISAMTVLLFAEYWNIIDQAIVFLDKVYDNPLSVYLGQVVDGDPGTFFAVAVFYLIPALLVFVLGQDYLTEGIELSELKM